MNKSQRHKNVYTANRTYLLKSSFQNQLFYVTPKSLHCFDSRLRLNGQQPIKTQYKVSYVIMNAVCPFLGYFNFLLLFEINLVGVLRCFEDILNAECFFKICAFFNI